ncbi:hypothetical protein M407DRAFT_225320 [Tulasnella calospora MUT 4182]|uniref:Uncharacterized protein n=1 Tax=Tulasnella calospora MUT 4182 TaxID=1051891 RepID=A0A0C3M8N6_9AGAM|nr:hypothetical protein M407DRAFT_225320 [Tulasnella calospora MUT 4182]
MVGLVPPAYDIVDLALALGYHITLCQLNPNPKCPGHVFAHALNPNPNLHLDLLWPFLCTLAPKAHVCILQQFTTMSIQTVRWSLTHQNQKWETMAIFRNQHVTSTLLVMTPINLLERTPLLQLLLSSVVDGAVKRASWDLKSVVKADQQRTCGSILSQSLCNAVRKLVEMRAQIRQDPLHIDDIKGLTRVWDNLKDVISLSLWLDYVNRGICRNIMLAIHDLWKWLSVIRPFLISAVQSLDNPHQALQAGSYPWLTTLASAVKAFYMSQVQVQEFSRAAYLAGTSNLRVSLRRRTSGVPGVGEELHKAVIDYMEELLLRWAEFPDLIHDVATMHSYQNWDAQQTFSTWMQSGLSFQPHYHPSLAEKREKRKPSAEERVLVRRDVDQSFCGADSLRLQDGISRYGRLCKSIDGQTIQEGQYQPVPLSIYQDKPWITAAGEICAFLETLAPLIETDPHKGHLQLASHIPSVALCWYIMGLDDTWAHIEQKTRHQDQHIPFREIAPSRAEMRQIPREKLRTREGLFSISIWWAVTYGTSFTFCNKKIFSGPEEIEAEKATVQAEQSVKNPEIAEKLRSDLHLCTFHAYGQLPNSGCSWNSDTMNKLWGATETWEAFLGQHNGSIPFLQLHAWLRQVKMPQTASRDSLTAFLLAVDLSYGGILTEPTAREIGELYTLVTKGLGESQVKKIGFNPQVFEHTLCKISRIGKEAKLNLDPKLVAQFEKRVRKEITE